MSLGFHNVVSPFASELMPLVNVRTHDIPCATSARAIAMAVIVGAEGPSYRPVGATMFLDADGCVTGNLSSGCIDADVALHAHEVAASGKGKVIRYGTGSPFMDLRLPCGGSLVILVMPVRDMAPLRALVSAMHQRHGFDIYLTLRGPAVSPSVDTMMRLHVLPDPRFLVFGRGPEANAFAQMVVSTGYDTLVFGDDGHPLGATALAACAAADPYTAVVLFFHDHDVEPEILRAALAGRAFYIGAQGSRKTAANRLRTLRALGVSDDDCARVRGPIGLIPSTRDARTLAVSVLAEVLSEAVG